MTAEAKRLEAFLVAKQCLGTESVSAEQREWSSQSLFRIEAFAQLAVSSAHLTLADPNPAAMMAVCLAAAFMFGQQFERSEQMRREFGDGVSE